jgi:hypothetical protein
LRAISVQAVFITRIKLTIQFILEEKKTKTMWVARVFALLCVYSILGWMGHALEEPKGLRAGYLYANQTLVKTDAAACSYSSTCSTGGYSGVCLSVSSGCCAGTVSCSFYVCFTLFTLSVFPSLIGHCWLVPWIKRR